MNVQVTIELFLTFLIPGTCVLLAIAVSGVYPSLSETLATIVKNPSISGLILFAAFSVSLGAIVDIIAEVVLSPLLAFYNQIARLRVKITRCLRKISKMAKQKMAEQEQGMTKKEVEERSRKQKDMYQQILELLRQHPHGLALTKVRKADKDLGDTMEAMVQNGLLRRTEAGLYVVENDNEKQEDAFKIPANYLSVVKKENLDVFKTLVDMTYFYVRLSRDSCLATALLAVSRIYYFHGSSPKVTTTEAVLLGVALLLSIAAYRAQKYTAYAMRQFYIGQECMPSRRKNNR